MEKNFDKTLLEIKAVFLEEILFIKNPERRKKPREKFENPEDLAKSGKSEP